MSPPIVFVSGNGSTWDPLGSFVVSTPSVAKLGDTLLLIIAFRGTPAAVVGSIDGDAALAGWTIVQTITTASNRIMIYRRVLDDSDIGAHTATFTASQGQAALIALRAAQDIPATGAANDSTTTTSHVCPSQTLAQYSGMFLGVVVLNGSGPGGFPGANNVMSLFDGTNSIMVAMLRPEVPGATGSQTATTGATRTGIAASFQIAADPLVGGQGLAFSVSPVGAIGLPIQGV